MPLQDEMPLDSDGPRRRHPEEWQRSLDVDILLSTWGDHELPNYIYTHSYRKRIIRIHVICINSFDSFQILFSNFLFNS